MNHDTLKSIIRDITHQILNEMMSTDTKDAENDPSVNSSASNVGMTPAEEKRLEREKEHERQLKLKGKEMELKVAKKENEFNGQKLRQQQRTIIPSLNKDIQQLKGAKI